ncbi:MAG TPA: Smr/MutS family protein [Candidatus Ozemobacteraceae bacterium]|nr:Smr/MutS family protein [Candidatus Ozemobacteraceae bacterium]
MESKSLDNLEFPKILKLIAAYAGSRAGQAAVMALQPQTDLSAIEKSLGEMDELYSFIAGGGHMPVSGLRDLRDLLMRLKTGSESLTGDDLLSVRADIEVARAVQKAFESAGWFSERLPDSRLVERVNHMPTLGAAHREIVQSISDKGEVRDDASPRLASLRRELAQARSEIERRLTELVNTGGDMFQDRFFTIRGDRYVVPVRASSQSLMQGLVHDTSGSGQTVFMEPLEFLPLNNRLARLRSEEREEVLRILRALTDMLRNASAELGDMFDTLVFFDALLARVRFAREYDAHRPEIARDREILLTHARHPLLHPDCVPLDLAMDATKACVVVTGPNGGGKTVALKIVGVNALLMQSGCYIMADGGSRLPVFDPVLADIGEAQSIEEHLSTFTSHLKRLKEMLDVCGQDALVLIDEIGGGTDPAEGSALAGGILKEITRRGAFSLVTSHFDALKEVAFVTPGFVNAGMEFDESSFRPTFRFLMGVPGRSNALAVARQFGLPETVLADLALRMGTGSGEEKALFAALERERHRAEALRRAWEEKNVTADRKQAELDTALEQLNEFRRKKRDALTEEFEQRLKERLRNIEDVIHQLREAAARGGTVESDVERARDTLADAKTALNELELHGERHEPAAPVDREPLRAGEPVVWTGMPHPGILESPDAGRGRAIVSYDGKRMTVPLSELSRAGVRARPEKAVSTVIGTAAPLIRDEIDLRGMRVEEALENVENYLKTAEAQKLGRVFLIHGKGTGALQKSIHEFLKKSRWRTKFRFGRYGEGDLGVTVVVFDPAADAKKPGEDDRSSRGVRLAPGRRSKGDRDRS